jgi:CRP-like cAMP-binding protein
LSGFNQRLGALIRKMESVCDLNDAQRAAIIRMPTQVVELKANQAVVRFGDRPSRSCVLIDGFMARYVMTGDGKRQILSFHIPGEIPDLQSLHLRTMDHELGTLTACTVGFVKHEDLQSFLDEHPRIASAFWRETLIDAAIFREWMVGIGRREAPSRMAHFFCEMFERLRAVGLVDDQKTCPLPFTQTELGDALGLSTVHVNRTLQELRGSGLVAFAKGSLTVKDWGGLAELGDFDSTYLHQDVPKAA